MSTIEEPIGSQLLIRIKNKDGYSKREPGFALANSDVQKNVKKEIAAEGFEEDAGRYPGR